MGKLWTLITQLHSLAGPVLTLLYPLYASVIAIESTSKYDEQWLAYWIIYSFLSLMEMLLQPLLEWVPIWYDVKLLVVAWLVLPQFKGAAFLYERFVRQHIRKYITQGKHHSSSDGATHPKISATHPKIRFMDFITPKKDS
ncbi:HVA22-like protein e [Arachis duranensis]|uniref:HVA22-like protein n=1 Tax=Arachis duranensis TaxID=130453 RepID=A0A6P4CQZ5_ARADU|nr:HVA22-like protein e [Arachis duranensis]